MVSQPPDHNFVFPVTALDQAMARANKEEIKIPFGVGICGHVAKTKEIVNLENAYEVRSLHKHLEQWMPFYMDAVAEQSFCIRREFFFRG